MAGRQPLLSGYKVALFYEGEGQVGYLQTAWSTGVQLGARVGLIPLLSREDRPDNFEDGIFQILSGDGATASRDHDEIKFGQMVRLRHARQNKFLACSKKKAGGTDKATKQVSVQPIVGQRKHIVTKWRIAPRYQVRGEGEKVCDGDQITLQPVLNTAPHFLSLGTHKVPGSAFTEINATLQETRSVISGYEREFGFTIKVYDTSELDPNTLRGGDCLMLYHKECKGYLTAAQGGGRSKPSVHLLTDAEREKDPKMYLSNGMFIVEMEDALTGGAMQATPWDAVGAGAAPEGARFRLRLLGNRSDAYYLTLVHEPVAPAEGPRPRRGSNASGRGPRSPGISPSPSPRDRVGSRDSGSQHRVAFDPSLGGWRAALCKPEEAAEDVGTLFQFLPAGDNNDLDLFDGSRVILSCQRAAADGERPAPLYVHVAHGARRNGPLHVGCAARPLQQDGFELRKVPPDAFLSLSSVLSQVPPIRSYIAALEALAATPVEERAPTSCTALDPERLLAALEEMVQRCYSVDREPVPDVLYLEGSADRAQQLLLVDQGVPELCMKLVRAQESLGFPPAILFNPLMQFPTGTHARRPSELVAHPPYRSLRIALLCYKLMRSIVRSSPDLAWKVAQAVGEVGLTFMLAQAEFRNDALGALPCLEEMYDANRDLQLETSTAFIERICLNILEHVERGAASAAGGFLRLLPYVTSTKSGGSTETLQERAAALLLNPEGGAAASPFLRMRRTPNGELEVGIPQCLSVAPGPLSPATDASLTPAAADHLANSPARPACTTASKDIVEDGTPGLPRGHSSAWVALDSFCDVAPEAKGEVMLTHRGSVMEHTSELQSQMSHMSTSEELYQFFHWQLELFARFCVGNGEGSRIRTDLVRAMIPTDCINEALLGERYRDVIPDQLQCVFARLVRTAVLDNFPNVHHRTVRLVKVLSQFDESSDVTAECPEKCAQLRDRSLEYLTNHPKLSMALQSAVERVAVELDVLQLFIRCGFFTLDEVPGFARILTAILDSTTDTYLGDEVLQETNPRLLRRQASDLMQPLFAVRIAVIDTLNMLLDYLNNEDVHRIFHSVRGFLGGDDAELAFPHMSQLQTFSASLNRALDEVSEENYVDPDRHHNVFEQGLEHLVDGARMLAEAGGKVTGMIASMVKGTEEASPFHDINQLLEILLECGQCDDDALRVAASGLLFRLTNRGDGLYRMCANTQVLRNAESLEYYTKVRAQANRIEVLLLEYSMTDPMLTELASLLKELAQSVTPRGSTEDVFEQCSILGRLDVHDTIFASRAWRDDHVFEDTASMSDCGGMAHRRFVRAFVNYLETICRHSAENQTKLMQYVPDLVQQTHTDGTAGILPLLEFIFVDNVKNCVVAPDCVIRALITVPVDLRNLTFLKNIMAPRGRPLYRRQQAVYSAFLDTWHEEMSFGGKTSRASWTVPFRKPMRMVKDMLRSGDHLDVYGKVAVHLALTTLLSSVATGKEKQLKRDIRHHFFTDRFLSPVEHLLSVLIRREVPFWYRRVYLSFFQDVCLVDDDPAQTALTLSISTHACERNAMAEVLTRIDEELLAHCEDRWQRHVVRHVPFRRAGSVTGAGDYAEEEEGPTGKLPQQQVTFATDQPQAAAAAAAASAQQHDVLCGVDLYSFAVFAEYIVKAVAPFVEVLAVQLLQHPHCDSASALDVRAQLCSILASLLSLYEQQAITAAELGLDAVERRRGHPPDEASTAADAVPVELVGYVDLVCCQHDIDAADISSLDSDGGGDADDKLGMFRESGADCDVHRAEHSAAVMQHSKLLSPETRAELGCFLIRMRTIYGTMYEDVRGVQFPPESRLLDAMGVEVRPPSPALEVTVQLPGSVPTADLYSQLPSPPSLGLPPRLPGSVDGEAAAPPRWSAMQRWGACFELLKDEPFLRPQERFKALVLLLVRKGTLGKGFIRETLIGHGRGGRGGMLHRKSDVQLHTLHLLTQFCRCPSESELRPGTGGNDFNILCPPEGPQYFVPAIADEEATLFRMDDAPVLFADDMSTQERQDTLVSYGIARVLVDLFGSSPLTQAGTGMPQWTTAVLELGIAVLMDGNTAAQDSMMDVFLSNRDETFFMNIRHHLRQFMYMMIELQKSVKKEATRRVGAEGVGNGKSMKERLFGKESVATHRVPVNVKTEALPDDIIDEFKTRFHVSQMATLMRFLQLLTEGHHLPMQNYLRIQKKQITSLDVVEAVVTFLQQVKYLSRVTADVVAKALACLLEFLQGPCAGNQRLVVALNIGETVCKLLNDGEGPRVSKTDLALSTEAEVQESLWTIRQTAADVLMGCLEGCDSTSVSKMLFENVSLDVLAENMNLSFVAGGMQTGDGLLFTALDVGKGLVRDIFRPVGSGDELTDKLNLGCSVFIFLKVMLDAQKLRQRELGGGEAVCWHDIKDQSLQHVLRKEENSCYRYFNQLIATIEVARNGQVERIYFRALTKTKVHLSEKSKERVIGAVTRDEGDASKVADFFDHCQALIYEIDYMESLSRQPFLAVIHKFNEPLAILGLITGLVINAILLLFVNYTEDDNMYSVAPGPQEDVLYALGTGNLVLQCIHMTHFLLGPLIIHVKFQWLAWAIKAEDERKADIKENMGISDPSMQGNPLDKVGWCMWMMHTLWMVSTCWAFWVRAAYLFGSILGYTVSPAFYSLLPLEIIAFSNKLQNVVLAVTTHGGTLLLTFGLMLVVMFAFAAWAFFRFPEYMDEDGFGAGFNCDTLLRCWVLLSTYGLRQGGGMADIMLPVAFGDSRTAEKLLFDVLYFLVLIILFLNIVFGIIIDTFAELRQARSMVDEDQHSKCFICGLERSIYDREAAAEGGFEHHWRREHNMWTYLHFLHYVVQKDTSTLSGQEKYVFDMIEAKDASFFPVGQSLVLSLTSRDGAGGENEHPGHMERHWDPGAARSHFARIHRRLAHVDEALKQLAASNKPQAVQNDSFKATGDTGVVLERPISMRAPSAGLAGRLRQPKPSVAAPSADIGQPKEDANGCALPAERERDTGLSLPPTSPDQGPPTPPSD